LEIPLHHRHLSTAALVCAALAAGACLLDWAVPPRSLAAINAAAHANHMRGNREAVAAAAREAARAFPLQGTDEPFHGLWVVVLAGVGAALAAAGSAAATRADGHSSAEGVLRGSGVTLGLGFLVVLMDFGSDIFDQRARAPALWFTAGLLLVGCLAATFASTKLEAPPDPSPEADSTPSQGTPEVASTSGQRTDEQHDVA